MAVGLLRRAGAARRPRVAKGHVVVFHTGGQVHHAWDVQRFRTLVPGRNRVANRLVVEVDTETIPTDVRVEIFSSFRDAMLKSDKSVTLENVIADWLENSPEIRDAESQLTRQALQASRRGVGASVLDLLNQAIRPSCDRGEPLLVKHQAAHGSTVSAESASAPASRP